MAWAGWLCILPTEHLSVVMLYPLHAGGGGLLQSTTPWYKVPIPNFDGPWSVRRRRRSGREKCSLPLGSSYASPIPMSAPGGDRERGGGESQPSQSSSRQIDNSISPAARGIEEDQVYAGGAHCQK